MARRLAGVALSLALLAAVAPAGAITEQQVKRAEANAKALLAEIRKEQSQLDAMMVRAGELSTAVYEARYEYEVTLDELNRTRVRLKKATRDYEELRAQLDARAAEAYMQGPGSSIEFLLGSASLTELSDRIEFMGAAAQTDVDLAVEVESLRNQLEADEADLERLQLKQSEKLTYLEEKEAELDSLMKQQGTLIASIKDKQQKAEEYAKKLGREYERQIAQAFGGKIGKGAIKVCPVAPPRGVSNSFGAPRYGGGYHLHAGVDIFAPYGTPIYAPFAGRAESGSNTLGGLAVYVYGSEGYVYNAHLSRFARTGSWSVQPGDVIGYVGDSGDAQGTSPHDHFEWHPDVIPSGWPESIYGYSVIGDAVNPYPLLTSVC